MSFTINNTIQNIVQRGNEVIDTKYVDKWETYCTNFHNSWSAYGDAILNYALDAIRDLNSEKSFYDVKEIVRKQNHSGISYDLLCNIIYNFCSKGAEFIKYADTHWYD